MTRSKAIAKKCLECSGYSFKEVTVCHIFDCPLWEFRFGNSLKSKYFKQRMDSIPKRFPEEFSYMTEMYPEYSKNIVNSRVKRYLATYFQKNSDKHRLHHS